MTTEAGAAGTEATSDNGGGQDEAAAAAAAVAAADSGTGAGDDGVGTADAGAGKDPADKGSILGKGADPDKDGKGGDWPDDWRDRLSGGDAKLRGRLDRFGSPRAILDSYLSAEQQIRGKGLKKAPGEGATPEELAAFRKEAGIPETPDGYTSELAKRFAQTDQDKAIVGAFHGVAHKHNLPPGAVNDIYAMLGEHTAAATEAREEADADLADAGEEALRGEWGGDYRRNVTAVDTFLATQPTEVQAALLEARDAQGNRLAGSPAFIRWMHELAADLNPGASFEAGSGGATMANRKAEIEAIMATDMNRYYREGLDKEYGKIAEAEERGSGRRNRAA